MNVKKRLLGRIKITEQRLLFCILAIALISRIAVGVVSQSWLFSTTDNSWEFGFEMGQIAQSLAQGNGFRWPQECSQPDYKAGEPTAWMAPVYPLLIAGSFHAFGTFSEVSALALELFQTLVSVLICVLLYRLGKRFFNAEVGLIAALVFSLYPAGIHYAVQKIWSTSLFTLCTLIIILQLDYQAENPRNARGVLLGIILGFTALLDPVALGVYPFAIGWLYLTAKGDRRTKLRVVGVMGMALILTLSPWIVRNYAVFGKAVLIKSNFGNELFLGNTEPATGGWRDMLFRWNDPRRDISEKERAHLSQISEVDRNRILMRKAVATIVEDPLGFSLRSIRRIGRFWIYTRPMNSHAARISLAFYVSVLILAVAGLFQGGADPRGRRLLMLFLLFLPAPYYLTIVALFRYRFPIEPILILFAGNALWRIRNSLADKRPSVVDR